MCLGEFLFGPNLFVILWASWTYMSISFTRLRNFSFIIFLNTISISCSSSSPSGTPDLDVGTFKGVLEVPKPLLIFMNSCFFILFWLNVYFFVLLQIIDLSSGFLPFSVDSLYTFFYFIFHSLHFFLYFANILNQFWASWLPLFWTVHLIGWLSLSLSSFSGILICSFIWGIFPCLSTPVT